MKDVTPEQSAETYKKRFEYTLIGKATVNEDFTFRDVNEQLCQYFGVTKSALIGRTFGDITPSPIKEIDEANARLVRDGKTPCYMMPKIYQISSDSPITHAIISVMGVWTEGGRFSHYDVEILKISEEVYQMEVKRLLSGYSQLQKKHHSSTITLLLSLATLSKKDWMQLIAVIAGAIVATKEVTKYALERFFTELP